MMVAMAEYSLYSIYVEIGRMLIDDIENFSALDIEE